jgi:divinyl protochlorophyllide a 8-vinyl-reductase
MGSASTWPASMGTARETAADHSGKIGPNAILQVFDVLDETVGPQQTTHLAQLAGLGHHRVDQPLAMVDERDVVALHKAVRATFDADTANQILWRAGAQTAEYILANRIPKPAQRVLGMLPAPLASPILLKAIAKNAWTFAGSGRFAYRAGRPAELALTDCPACLQVYRHDEPCLYYTATMEGLFRALVHRQARIHNTPGPSVDGRTRTFVLDWPS